MRSKLGIHWVPTHGRMKDVELARQIQPTVIKIINPDANRLSQMFDASPNSLFILRDHPRSEQHEDMQRDPVGTGSRHADECLRDWQKLQSVGVRLPKLSQCVWTGINEPIVWDALERTVTYYSAFAARLGEHKMVGGLLNLSVGWPANTGKDQPVDWTPYNRLEPYFKNHYLILHEYWSRQGCQQNWGWWAGRYTQCPYDAKIIIGECGIDVFVEDTSVGQHRRGWLGWKKPEEYMAELAEYDRRICQDGRIVGAVVFTTDYGSRDWESFDTEGIHFLWKQHAKTFDGGEPEKPPVKPPIPDVGMRFIFPFRNARPAITQHFGQNPQDYVKFGLNGHNGTDFACPVGTDISAVADGKVVWTDVDVNYGTYVRIYHEQHKLFSFYAHLDKSICKVGDLVKQGQTIAKSGNTGNSTGAHLHLEFRLAKDENTYADFQSPFGHRAQIDPFPLLVLG